MEKKIYLNLSITASITAILTSFLVSFFIMDSSNYMANFISILPATIGLLVVILILLNMVSYYLTKNIMRPINYLTRDIENIMTYKSLKNIDSYKELDPLIGTIQDQKYEIEKYIDKLEEVDSYRKDLTANVTHELKTPLTSINGFAEMLASGVVSPEDTIKFGEIINKEGNRLLILIDSLLKLSSIETNAPNFELINIKEVFTELYYPLKIIADKSNVRIKFEVENIIIKGNKRMIKDLLYNLIHNSIKYNEDGGLVSISIYKLADTCIINVKDTGIGIDKDQQDKIFNRFYTVEKSRNKDTSGTGLGLSIVKHIVEVHGGSISLKSSLGEGTNIKISLPIKQ